MYSLDEYVRIYNITRRHNNQDIADKTKIIISKKGYILCPKCKGLCKEYNALQDVHYTCETCNG